MSRLVVVDYGQFKSNIEVNDNLYKAIYQKGKIDALEAVMLACGKRAKHKKIALKKMAKIIRKIKEQT